MSVKQPRPTSLRQPISNATKGQFGAAARTLAFSLAQALTRSDGAALDELDDLRRRAPLAAEIFEQELEALLHMRREAALKHQAVHSLASIFINQEAARV